MKQCTAHGLAIETVQGLRENQKETYTLIRDLTAENTFIETKKARTGNSDFFLNKQPKGT